MAPVNTSDKALVFQLRPRLLALSVAACFSITPAWALPTGAQVAAGAAKFNQAGNSLVVTNTPGAIINWQSFSIGALESVRFQQQSSLSSVLNRVTGSASSAIHGALRSNGRVFLVNPNGILFGPNSKVDVNGLIASSLDISNEDFRKGRLNFQAGAQAGSVKNAGTLDAAQNIYLVGPDIENSGIIRSAQGEVLLAAGRQVTLVDGAHPDIQVVVSAPADQAVNLGDIVAGKISVFGSLVQQRGRMNADRAEVDEHGRIVFRASGDTLLDGGSVSARNSQGEGGRIEVLGNRVAVTGNATLDASGAKGGGTILVGGDYQGRNPDIPNAQITYFGPDATLKANATKVGAGGTAIVWADDTTRAYGSIEAKGGATKGDGGFVEVSGKQHLDYRARTDTTAANGKTGTLLLDPDDIVITAGTGESGSDGNTEFIGVGGGTPVSGSIFYAETGPSVVYESELEGTTAANVILEANFSITTSGFTSSDTVLLPGGRSLTLRTKNQSLSTTNGIDLTCGSLCMGLAFETSGGGGITLQTGDIASPQAANIFIGKLKTNGGDVSINSSGQIVLQTGIDTSGTTYPSTITTGGDVDITATDSITLAAINTSGGAGSSMSNLDGADAGSVTILSTGSGVIVSNITAKGGDGAHASTAVEGGWGGWGGDIDIRSQDVNMHVVVQGIIDTSGGAGGNGGGAGFDGGEGGDAGTILLKATQGNVRASFAASSLFAKGGDGGNAYVSATAASGGNGGSPGQISLEADGNILFESATVLGNDPGYAGDDHTGTSPNTSAAYTDVKLKTTTGNVTQTGGTSITGGANLDFNVAGNVSMGESGNVFSYATGTVGGQIVSLGNVAGIGTTGLSATGGLSLTSSGAFTQLGNLSSTSADITVTADGAIAMGTLGAGNVIQTTSSDGDIIYTNSAGANGATIALGKLDAGSGNVTVNAKQHILDNNDTTKNVIANSASLTSSLGAASASYYAISADTQVSDLTATVTTGYGGIAIRNTGSAITGLSLSDQGAQGTYGISLSNNAGITLPSASTISSPNRGVEIETTSGTLTINGQISANLNAIHLQAPAIDIHGGSVSGGDVQLSATSGNLTIRSSSSGSNATVYGFPDLHLSVAGNLIFDNTAYGGSNAVAIAGLPQTIHLDFTGSGGIVLNDSTAGTAAFATANSGYIGMFSGGAPESTLAYGAVAGSGLLASGGVFASSGGGGGGGTVTPPPEPPPTDPCLVDPASCEPPPPPPVITPTDPLADQIACLLDPAACTSGGGGGGGGGTSPTVQTIVQEIETTQQLFTSATLTGLSGSGNVDLSLGGSAPLGTGGASGGGTAVPAPGATSSGEPTGSAPADDDDDPNTPPPVNADTPSPGAANAQPVNYCN